MWIVAIVIGAIMLVSGLAELWLIRKWRHAPVPRRLTVNCPRLRTRWPYGCIDCTIAHTCDVRAEITANNEEWE